MELNSKLESAVNARHIHDNSDSWTNELMLQLQKCIIEKNNIEIRMEEANQDTGLYITFSLFGFTVCMFGSHFLQY